MEAIIREVDFVLQELRSEYLTDRHGFPEAAQRIQSLFGSREILSVWIADSDGRIAYSSIDDRSSTNVAHRDYFQFHRASAGEDRLYVSPPLVGQYTQRWMAIFSRRLEIDRQFAGTIMIAVPPSYFTSRLGAVGVGERVSVSHLPDGNIFVDTLTPGRVGDPTAADAPFLKPDALPYGTFRDEDDAGEFQIMAWRRVDDSPLVVMASGHEEALLAPTETAIATEFRNNVMTSSLALLLVASVTVIILRDVGLRQRLHKQDALHKVLFDAMPDGMMTINHRSEITLWNEAALGLLGVDEEGLKERRVRLYDIDGKPVSISHYPSMKALDRAGHQGLFYVMAQGRRRWLSFDARVLPSVDGVTPHGAIVAFTDVTRLVQLEDSMRTSQSVFEAAGEGIMVTDAGRRIISVNPAFTRITGFSADEALGKGPGELLGSGAHDQEFYAQMDESLKAKGYWEGEITNRRKDGSLFIEWLKINVVHDEAAQVLRYVALLSDISERKRQDQEIWKRANFDALTGLPNRTLFTDRLNQAIGQADRHKTRVVVFFIDLDKFKAVNDTLGHKAGDDLLRQVADRIQSTIRAEDTAARVGGDEFLVLLPQAGDDASLLHTGERIREALCLPFDIGGHEVNISASIGIADALAAQSDPALVIKRADAAMYRAKSSGANRVVMM
ncbi:diguanylate cyclase domain-containing protein [Zavarzinia aquatilis]|nr:diguanylate cyclase [Zavarzinia aquatilis]